MEIQGTPKKPSNLGEKKKTKKIQRTHSTQFENLTKLGIITRIHLTKKVISNEMHTYM